MHSFRTGSLSVKARRAGRQCASKGPTLVVGRTMLLLLLLCLSSAIAAPAIYDQRQDGGYNVRADVKNVLLLFAIPEKLPLSVGLFNGLNSLLNDGKHNTKIQERADVNVMEAFLEPPSPYHVEIGESTRNMGEGDGRTVEVVIAGRRSGAGASVEAEPEEVQLLGAREQCGPGRRRDPDSLMCREDPLDLPPDNTKQPVKESGSS